MSLIRIASVLSVSSEDKVYVGENLLSNENFRKWKCATAGEKNAIIIFQLQSPEQICSIDIGNEGSAFVEVLVGKAADSDKYEVLLPAASFMSPAESRCCKNLNRVRMFTTNDFNKVVVAERWDRIKFVCSQPFNQEIQYGLSFVRLFSPTKKINTDNKLIDLGSLSEDFTEKKEEPSTLFKRKMQEDPLQTPSKVLPLSSRFPASNSPLKNALSPKSPAESKTIADFIKEKRNQDHTAEASDSSNPSPKETEVSSLSPPGAEVTSLNLPETESLKSELPANTTKKTQNKAKSRPCLAGVVFTLSGFQNPLRSEIRDCATKLGATYRTDWSKDCTHLVCAFKNTPKFHVVKKLGGTIVKKEWIFDCAKARKRLPITSYLMYSNRKSSKEDKSSDSENEATGDETSLSEESEEDKLNIKHGDDRCQQAKRSSENAKSHVLRTLSLPNYFENDVFFLYTDMSAEDISACTRLIIAYGGKVSDYMSKDVNMVVSEKSWNPEFDEAVKSNPSLLIVDPSWIQACHDKRRRVNVDEFLVKK